MSYSIETHCALAEVVLEDGVHDAPDAEGGFDDGRHHFFHVHLLLFSLDRHVILGDFHVTCVNVKLGRREGNK